MIGLSVHIYPIIRAIGPLFTAVWFLNRLFSFSLVAISVQSPELYRALVRYSNQYNINIMCIANWQQCCFPMLDSKAVGFKGQDKGFCNGFHFKNATAQQQLYLFLGLIISF